ncbi:MAG: alpha/beta fold hydrolase [Calditrichaeota bacterium]|nr:MAG: alpha/beta fold hydrolase [Calditrichota bacterium]
MERKMKKYREMPIVIASMGRQLVGIHHQTRGDQLLIMCHGFTGNKCENKRLFVDAARTFVQEGLNVIRFDFYGSGDSEGDFADSLVSTNIANLRDVIAWGLANGFAHIAVLGLSMGAATTILTVADQPVEAVVLWSTVPDMKQLFNSYVDQAIDKVAHIEFVEHDGWRLRTDFIRDAVQYDIYKAFAALTIPKLVVQGTADSSLFVDGFFHFRDIATPPADFMEIPEAGHTFQTSHHRWQVIRQTVLWLKRRPELFAVK